MTKWPVDGSVHDCPEGVLQNVRDNLGLATAITTRPSLISRGRDRRLPSRLYIQVAFGSSATSDLVWRLDRGLSGETLVSPDKTGNYMCLSGETSVSPDKAILKGKLGLAGRWRA